MTSTLLSCTLIKCNKKYKTEKGLKKHYTTKHTQFRSYDVYRQLHVNEIIQKNPIPSKNPKNPKNPKTTINPTAPHVNTPSQKVQKLNAKLDDMAAKLMSIESRLEIVEKPEKKFCIVCWDHESDYALVPCGHKLLCATCAISVLSGKKECPVCMRQVYDMMQIWDTGRIE